MHHLNGLLLCHYFSQRLEMVVDGRVLMAAGILHLEAGILHLEAENHAAVETDSLEIEQAGILEVVEAGTLELEQVGIRLEAVQAGTLATVADILVVEVGILEMLKVGSPLSVAVQYYTVLVGKHLELSWQPLAVADT